MTGSRIFGSWALEIQLDLLLQNLTLSPGVLGSGEISRLTSTTSGGADEPVQKFYFLEKKGYQLPQEPGSWS